mgnify:CR=1 FL=1
MPNFDQREGDINLKTVALLEKLKGDLLIIYFSSHIEVSFPVPITSAPREELSYKTTDLMGR